MNEIIALIVESHAEPIASRPLLGKTCRQYVQHVLETSHIPMADEPKGSFRRLLLIRENASCLDVETLHEFVNVKQPITGIRTLADSLSAEPIAVVIEAPVWQAALQAEGCTPAKLAADFLRLPAHYGQQEIFAPVHPQRCFAVTNASTYAMALSLLREVVVQKHMENGVIVLDPFHTLIDESVEIGSGTVIYPGNILEGETVIGSKCTLYPGNRMRDAQLGDEVSVENSVLINCTVGNRTTVGPFAYLRPATKVGEGCRVGDFVEIKNSVIDNGTKISHLTYVGDSDLGKDINLGCGVVFVNYDGKAKNRSRVEDHAFIGCNCNLVAPVTIGENAYLAAGSTITEDVPADALFVARSRGVVKEDWVKRRKEKGML